MTFSQDIEARVSIVDVVREYLTIQKAGVNFKALCPFHNDRTPSLMISPHKNIAYCFACQTGGGPIKFVSEIEKISYHEAMQILAKKAGIEMKTNIYIEKNETIGDLYSIHTYLSEFYHEELIRFKEVPPNSKNPYTYCQKRGLSPEIINKFFLGYSPGFFQLGKNIQSKNNISQELLQESGIMNYMGKDKFSGRLIFPIQNIRGHTVAFTGRVLDEKLPKYLNSPTNPIFEKGKILFGFPQAKKSISQEKCVFIVEGQMDVISLHQAGITNVVGISGTALTQHHIQILKRFTHNIYLCLDNDDAGKKATLASIENLTNQDVDIFVIQLNPFKDPDDLIMNKKQENIPISAHILKQYACSHIQFLITIGSFSHDLESITGKKQALKDLLPHVASIESPLEKDTYIKEISKILKISREIIYSELKKLHPFQIQKTTFLEKNKHSSQVSAGFSHEEDVSENKAAKFGTQEIIFGFILNYNLGKYFLKNFAFSTEIKQELFQNFCPNLYIFFDQQSNKVNLLPEEEQKKYAFFVENICQDMTKEKVLLAFDTYIHKLSRAFFEEKKKWLRKQKNIDIMKETQALHDFANNQGII